MKKVLSLVLVLLLALSFSSIAMADEYDLTTYVHPTLGYSIKAPANWIPLDAETISTLMSDPAIAEAFPGVDLSMYIEQCVTYQMSMFLALNGDNFNIVGQNLGIPFTAQQLVDYLMPSLREQYKALFSDVVFLVEGDVCQTGNKEYAYVVYQTNNGINDILGCQFCICESGTLYNITFTVNDVASFEAYGPMFDEILASFTE